ncbi:hypothetical protein BDW22DRAFT_1349950 [Trametopsis cervina]|nr:hypothetical protein BDW22DRAFT_1349950 [Trametopsis cervina]
MSTIASLSQSLHDVPSALYNALAYWFPNAQRVLQQQFGYMDKMTSGLLTSPPYLFLSHNLTVLHLAVFFASFSVTFIIRRILTSRSSALKPTLEPQVQETAILDDSTEEKSLLCSNSQADVEAILDDTPPATLTEVQETSDATHDNGDGRKELSALSPVFEPKTVSSSEPVVAPTSGTTLEPATGAMTSAELSVVTVPKSPLVSSLLVCEDASKPTPKKHLRPDAPVFVPVSPIIGGNLTLKPTTPETTKEADNAAQPSTPLPTLDFSAHATTLQNLSVQSTPAPISVAERTLNFLHPVSLAERSPSFIHSEEIIDLTDSAVEGRLHTKERFDIGPITRSKARIHTTTNPDWALAPKVAVTLKPGPGSAFARRGAAVVKRNAHIPSGSASAPPTSVEIQKDLPVHSVSGIVEVDGKWARGTWKGRVRGRI